MPHRVRQTIENKVLYAFVLGLLLLILSGLLALYEVHGLLASESRRMQLHHAEMTTEQLLSALQDAETGQRGYLLTGIPSYLQPYYEARLHLREIDQQVHAALRSEPRYAGELADIDRLTRLKLAELEATVARRSQGGLNAALPDVLTGNGKVLMDRIRADLASIQLGLQAQISAIKLSQGQRMTRAWTSLLALSLLLALVQGVVYVLVVRELREKRRLKGRLREHLGLDTLTGLPTGALLIEWIRYSLAQARRDGSHVALLRLNLDEFRIVNARLGEAEGDCALIEVTRRLLTTARSSDVVARLHGDEFAVLMPGLLAAEEAAVFAQRLIDAFSLPLLPSLQEQHIGASIGIALFPQDGVTPIDLLAAAEQAQLAAKAAGKNRHQFATPQLELSATRLQTLHNDLHRALESHEFYLVYQPEISLASGRVTAVEALLRWRHPQLGEISPDEFIPLAERSGLILPIGAWVLRQACAQTMRWRREHGQSLRLSVNVATGQLEGSEFFALVREVLAQTALPAGDLDLEIVERLLLKDAAADALGALKGLGIRLVIDDFGTGYSSLSYLRRFSVDTLKIDRSFISGLPESRGDAAMARSILAMAAELDISVVAEGVETEAQASFLREAGCSLAQGYLFARPLAVADVPAFLEMRASAP